MFVGGMTASLFYHFLLCFYLKAWLAPNNHHHHNNHLELQHRHHRQRQWQPHRTRPHRVRILQLAGYCHRGLAERGGGGRRRGGGGGGGGSDPQADPGEPGAGAGDGVRGRAGRVN